MGHNLVKILVWVMEPVWMMFLYHPEQVYEVSFTYTMTSSGDTDFAHKTLTKLSMLKRAILWLKYWSELWNLFG